MRNSIKKIIPFGFLVVSFIFLSISWKISGEMVSIEKSTYKIERISCDYCNALFNEIPQKCSKCEHDIITVNIVFDKCKTCNNTFSKDDYCSKCGERLFVNTPRDEVKKLNETYKNNVKHIHKLFIKFSIMFFLSWLMAVASLIITNKKRG